MKKSLSWPGPIYIRLGKGGEPIISDEKNGFEIGKAIPLREKKNPKITILTTGVLGKAALEAADMFEARGLVTNVVHHHTIKPLDKKSVVSSGKESSIIITLEEHVLDGGFGSSVGEALIDAQLPKMPRVFRFGIPNIFSENYGSQDELLAVFGLSASSIFARVMQNF
jgi:transketolase